MKGVSGLNERKRLYQLFGTLILVVLATQSCVRGNAASSVLQMLIPLGGNSSPSSENSSSLPVGLTLEGGPTFYLSNQPGARNAVSVKWSADTSGTYEIRENSLDCSQGNVVQNGSYTSPDVMSYDVSTGAAPEGVIAMVVCLTTPTQVLSQAFYIARDYAAPTVLVSPGTGAYGIRPAIVATCQDSGGAGCGTIAYRAGGNPSMDVDGTVSTGNRYQSAIQPPDPTGPGGVDYYFQAIDLAGNKSPVLVQNYVVDSSLPTVTLVPNGPPTWPNLPATGSFSARFRVDQAGTAYLQVGGTDCSTGTQVGTLSFLPPPNAATLRLFSPVSVDIAANLAPGPNVVRICFKNTLNLWGFTTFTLFRDMTIPTLTSVVVASGANTAVPVAPDNATILVTADEPISIASISSIKFQGAGTVGTFTPTRITDQSYLFKLPVVENTLIDWQIYVRDRSGNSTVPTAIVGSLRTAMLKRQRVFGTGQTICRDNAGNSIPSCSGTGLNGSWPDVPGSRLLPTYRVVGGTGASQEAIVEDSQTGLIWTACGVNGFWNGTSCSVGANTGLTIAARTCDTMSTYASRGYAGLRGWRLPTISELSTIVSFNGSPPNLPPASFPMGVSDPFHTGTGSTTGDIYVMQPGSGSLTTRPSTSAARALCVVDTNPGSVSPGFVDIGNGTVTDSMSNITWQKCSGGQGGLNCSTGTIQQFDFDGAVSYCNNLPLDGRTWRLPTINELMSIANPAAPAAPFVHPVFANSNGVYWSSTLDARTTPADQQLALQSNSGSGTTLSRVSGSGSGTVRCVSNGP